jgi:hypothetical protein
MLVRAERIKSQAEPKKKLEEMMKKGNDNAEMMNKVYSWELTTKIRKYYRTYVTHATIIV